MMFLLNETLTSVVSDDSHRVNLTEKKIVVFFIVARHLRKYDLIVQGLNEFPVDNIARENEQIPRSLRVMRMITHKYHLRR